MHKPVWHNYNSVAEWQKQQQQQGYINKIMKIQQGCHNIHNVVAWLFLVHALWHRGTFPHATPPPPPPPPPPESSSSLQVFSVAASVYNHQTFFILGT